MEWIFVIQALTFGFFTSFHCIGMCGPIAIALPLNSRTWGTRSLSAFLYNIGRTITYGIMGFIFGLLGHGLELAGFQQIVSIAMGSLMIFFVLFNALFKKTFRLDQKANSLVNRLQYGLAKRLKIKSYGSLLIIGFLNGLLPCGPVYAAIAMAIATTNVLSGTLFMILFGLATAPTLFIISMLGTTVGTKFKKVINKLIPYIIVVIGILFILRGLNLGIKFISPPDQKLKINEKNMMMERQDKIENDTIMFNQ